MIGGPIEGLVEWIATALFPPTPRRKWGVRIFWVLLTVGLAVAVGLLIDAA